MPTKQVKAGLSKANVNAISGAIGTATLNRLVPQFSTSVSYTKGQYTNYNNQLYRFTSDKSAGAWDSSKVESASLNDLINDVNGAVASVDNKANVDGNYQSMTVGLANNLDTKIVMVDQNPYIFRPTAVSDNAEREVGSPCKVKKIVGGTIAWKQMVENGNFDTDSGWTAVNGTKSVSNNIATFTNNTSGSSGQFYRDIQIRENHIYFIRGGFNPSKTTDWTIRLGNNYDAAKSCPANQWTTVERIVKSSQSGAREFNFYHRTQDLEVGDTCQFRRGNAIDLTAGLGSTIAEYILSLEQANVGAGVAWFKKHFPKEYYSYNSGSLVSVKTVGKKITHFNQLQDEITASGTSVVYKDIVLTHPVHLLPAQYCFSSESTALNPYILLKDANNETVVEGYVRTSHSNGRKYGVLTVNKECEITKISFLYDGAGATSGTFTYSNICINFHYDGERDGEYEPYEEETYPIEDIELKGIPKLDANNELYYDGDEYEPSGTVTRRYGSYTFTGQENWSQRPAGDWNIFVPIDADNIPESDTLDATNSMGLETKSSTYSQEGIDITSYQGQLMVYIRDSRVTDQASARALTTGQTIVYKLATPTEDSADQFTEQQESDNWGTEEYLPAGSVGDVFVPVGHYTEYLPDLKAKLEVAPNSPDEDGVYVMTRSSGVNSYSLLASWLASNGFDDITGFKESIGGTLRQCLCVKESLDFDNTNFVDLGSLTWNYSSDNNAFYANLDSIGFKVNGKILCTKYKSSSSTITSMENNTITSENAGIGSAAYIAIKDTSYTDATVFKSAMKGVLLAFEKDE